MGCRGAAARARVRAAELRERLVRVACTTVRRPLGVGWARLVLGDRGATPSAAYDLLLTAHYLLPAAYCLLLTLTEARLEVLAQRVLPRYGGAGRG